MERLAPVLLVWMLWMVPGVIVVTWLLISILREDARQHKRRVSYHVTYVTPVRK